MCRCDVGSAAAGTSRTVPNGRGRATFSVRRPLQRAGSPARGHVPSAAEAFIPDRTGSRMKVTVERAELLKSLSHVHRVVERRNTIPILANVLIRAARSKLSFKATDLDLEVIETIAAEVAPGGETTVPAHRFSEILRKLPGGAPNALQAAGGPTR